MLTELHYEFKSLLSNGFISAEKIFNLIESKDRDVAIIYSKLAIANSYINSAYVIYVTNKNKFRFFKKDIDNFFTSFRLFSHDVTNVLDESSIDGPTLKTTFNNLTNSYVKIMNHLKIDF